MSSRLASWTGFVVAVSALLLAQGCKVASVDGTLHYKCDDNQCPRGQGYVCVAGICQQPGGDGGTGSGWALKVVQQPESAFAAGNPIPLEIAVVDDTGNPVSTTDSITLSIGTNPTGAALSGATTVRATAGVATFSDVFIDTSGSGYTLKATTSGATSVETRPFDVVPAKADRLAFTQQPSSAEAGRPLGTVQVAVEDQFGNVVTTEAPNVTLSLEGGEPSATLGGNIPSLLGLGVVTFSNLRVDLPGEGYRLVATQSSSWQVESNPFDITPAPITGWNTDHYIASDGAVTDVLDSLSGYFVSAMVPLEDGGFDVYPGVTDGGTFTIEGVPTRPYFLNVYLGQTAYYIDDLDGGSRNTWDLGAYVQGRPGEGFANTKTVLSVTVDGASPWQTGDELGIYGSATGTADFRIYSGKTPSDLSGVLDGGTWTDSFDMEFFTGSSLLNGDPVEFYQLEQSYTDGGLPYERLTRSGTDPSVTISNGGSATLSGIMAPAPLNDLSATIDFDSFETLVPSGLDQFLIRQLPSDQFGWYWNHQPYVMSLSSPHQSKTETLALQYGLFDSGWDQIGLFGALNPVERSVLAGGSTTPYSFTLAATVAGPLARFTSGTVTATVQPIQNLEINSSDGSQTLTGVGTMPLVSWTAGGGMPPTFYRLIVWHLGNNAPNPDQVAQIRTTRTRVRLPPDILDVGNYYVLEVEAFYEPNANPDHPFESPFPQDTANYLSGILTP